MAKHISTKQILDHIKTAKAAVIDGNSLPLSFTDTDVVIGHFNFPIDRFDVGGMNPGTLFLCDDKDNFYSISFLDADGKPMDHPHWESEEYDTSKIRNSHLTNKKTPVPLSIYVPKTA